MNGFDYAGRHPVFHGLGLRDGVRGPSPSVIDKGHAMVWLVSLLSGLVFGIGLLVSGMAYPARVLGFLDVAGAWDPSLMFVMVGAIGVGLPAFTYARRRTVSLMGCEMRWPVARHIDRRLVAGSLLFGMGWGLAGICPGPALVMLGLGQGQAVVFVLAMLAGMALFELLEYIAARVRQRTQAA